MVAVLGIGVALVLIFLQLGFFGSVISTATVILDALDFDVVILSPDYQQFFGSGSFPRQRLAQAGAVQGVASVQPLYLGQHLWRCPPGAPGEEPRKRGILIMGIRLPPDPANPAEGQVPFRLPAIREQLPLLRKLGAVLIDRESRPEFGRPGEGGRFEAGGQAVDLVGQFTLGTGFGSDGAVVASDETFAKIFPGRSLEKVSMGLVRLRDGADPDEVARRLAAVLPKDVQVLTRSSLLRREIRHWVVNTSVGILFSFGVAVAFCVGAGVVYQILTSDITDHYAEYATLKAIGYSDGYLSRIVLTQAILLSVAGYVPAALVAVVLFAITRAQARIAMEFSPALALSVLALSTAMCSAAGLLAIRKVKTTDPANLF